MTSPNPSGVTVPPPGYADPHSFSPTSLAAQTWIPADNNFLFATEPPPAISGTGLMIAGTVYLRKIIPRQPFTLTTLWAALSTVGAGASTGSFAGLYSAGGVLLSTTADIAATFTGALGGIQFPLNTPQALSVGTFYWAAIVSNLATTQPTLRASTGTPLNANMNLTAAFLSAAVNGTSQTSLPATITPTSNTAAGAFAFWFGAT